MGIILGQVFVLFAFSAIGFALARCGIAKSEHADLLSKLLVYVFLPATTFKTFAQNCTVAYMKESYGLILASLVIVVVLVVLTRLGTRIFCPRSPEREVYDYSVVIPNFAYMGYAFTEALFGALGLMNLMLFALPVLAYANTIGYMMLSKKKATLKNLFLNPLMLSMIVGALFGILGLGAYVPDFLYTLLGNASACMAPVSMLLVGLVISGYKLTDLFRLRAVYVVSVLRVIVVPLAVGAVLMLFKDEVLLRSALLFYAMPCGLNTVVFVKNAGGDCRPGAALALVSTILACATIPLVLYVFGISAFIA